jgi:hypothetical protein
VLSITAFCLVLTCITDHYIKECRDRLDERFTDLSDSSDWWQLTTIDVTYSDLSSLSFGLFPLED